jgi:hypothetical protein
VAGALWLILISFIVENINSARLVRVVKVAALEAAARQAKLCSEGYEFPCCERSYRFWTETGRPNEFHNQGKHNVAARQTWRKLHFSIDEHYQVPACELTIPEVVDPSAVAVPS